MTQQSENRNSQIFWKVPNMWKSTVLHMPQAKIGNIIILAKTKAQQHGQFSSIVIVVLRGSSWL